MRQAWFSEFLGACCCDEGDAERDWLGLWHGMASNYQAAVGVAAVLRTGGVTHCMRGQTHGLAHPSSDLCSSVLLPRTKTQLYKVRALAGPGATAFSEAMAFLQPQGHRCLRRFSSRSLLGRTTNWPSRAQASSQDVRSALPVVAPTFSTASSRDSCRVRQSGLDHISDRAE